MTLFNEVAEDTEHKKIFESILQKYYGGKSDPKTIRILNEWKRTEK